eukprot:jgi/Tetstr1/448400/TSEL_035670.t1
MDSKLRANSVKRFLDVEAQGESRDDGEESSFLTEEETDVVNARDHENEEAAGTSALHYRLWDLEIAKEVDAARKRHPAVKEADAARKRTRRAAQGPEAKEADAARKRHPAIKEVDAARKRTRRAAQGPEAKEADAARKRHPAVKEADAARKRTRRAAQGPEANKEADAARKRHPAVKEADAARKRTRRAAQGPEAKEADAARKRQRRRACPSVDTVFDSLSDYLRGACHLPAIDCLAVCAGAKGYLLENGVSLDDVLTGTSRRVQLMRECTRTVEQERDCARRFTEELHRQSFQSVVCGVCQHRVVPSCEGGNTVLAEFVCARAGEKGLALRAMLESGRDNPTRTALRNFPGRAFAIARQYHGAAASGVPVCDACAAWMRRDKPTIPPCCIRACDIGDVMPPGLEPPCNLTYVEIAIVGFVRHSRYMVTVEDRSGQNRPAVMRHKASKNHFAVFPVAHPAAVLGRVRAAMPNSTFAELVRTTFAVVFITAKDVPQALQQLRQVPELKVSGERIIPYLRYFCDHREEHQRRSGWHWEPYQEVMDDVVRRFAHSEAVPEEVVRAAVLHTGDEGRELLKYADETTHVEYHRSTCDEGDYHMYCDRTSLVHDAPDEPDEDRLARAASEVLGTSASTSFAHSRRLVISGCSKPLPDYGHNFYVVALAPWFVYGTGKRPDGVSEAEYVKQLTGRVGSRMQDTAVLCAMANCLMRHDTTTRSLLQLRWQPDMESVLHNAREADLMRVAALLDAREAPAASDRDLVRRIHQMVCATAATSRFSERYMRRYRKQVLSASALFGLNGVFYTINPLASSHPVALKLAGMHVDFRGPAAPRDVKARAPPSYMERVAHMARNPMACKDFAIIVFRAFEKLDDLACICTTAASAIVAWMESLTTSVIAAEVEVHRQRAARDAPQKQLYENQPHPVLAVSYDPAINQRAMPEEWNGSQEHIVATAASSSGTGSVVVPSPYDVFLARLQDQNQFHTHTFHCARRGHVIGDDTNCGDGFGPPPAACAVGEAGESSLRLRRDRPKLVTHSRAILAATLCNNCTLFAGDSSVRGISDITSSADGSAHPDIAVTVRNLSFYYTCYHTKEDDTKAAHSVGAVSAKIKQRLESARRDGNGRSPTALQLLAGFVNTVLKGEVVSDVKAAAICSADAMCETSYVPFPFHVYDLQNRIVAMADDMEPEACVTLRAHVESVTPAAGAKQRCAYLEHSAQDFLLRDATREEMRVIGAYEFSACYERVPIKDNVPSTERRGRGRPLNPRFALGHTHPLAAKMELRRRTRMQVPTLYGEIHARPADSNDSVGGRVDDDDDDDDAYDVEAWERYALMAMALFAPWRGALEGHRMVMRSRELCPRAGESWVDAWRRFHASVCPNRRSVYDSILQHITNTCRAAETCGNTSVVQHEDVRQADMDVERASNKRDAEAAQFVEGTLDTDDVHLVRLCELVDDMELPTAPTGADKQTTQRQRYMEPLDNLFHRSIESERETHGPRSGAAESDIVASLRPPQIFDVSARATATTSAEMAVKEWTRELRAFRVPKDQQRAVRDGATGSPRAHDSRPTREFCMLSPESVLLGDRGSPPPTTSSAARPTSSRGPPTAQSITWERFSQPPTVKDAIDLWGLDPKQSLFVALAGNKAMELHAHDGDLDEEVEQLRMLCIGPAGCGKSRAIAAFVWLLWQHGVADWLIMSAYTHRAVLDCLGDVSPALGSIVYNTTCELFRIDPRRNRPLIGKRARDELSQTMQGRRFLILDEVMMPSAEHIAAIDVQCKVGMRLAGCITGPQDSQRPFGGQMVMAFGDHHQHPCIKGTPLTFGMHDTWKAMSDENSPTTGDRATPPPPVDGKQRRRSSNQCNMAANAGLQLLSGLDTVLIFNHQHRIKDDHLAHIAAELRAGNVTPELLDDLNSRAIGKPGLPADLHDPALRDAEFMTPRHARIAALTRFFVPRRARHAGQQLVRWRSPIWARASKDDAYCEVTDERLVALLARTPPANTANIPVIGHFYNGCHYIMRHSFNIAAHASNNNMSGG